MSEKKYTWEKLEMYRKDFKQSKAYLSYLKSHPDHHLDMMDMKTRYDSEESMAFYDQIDKDQLEQNIMNKCENMAKKVKFYQTEKA